jgi:hypothetical protein
MSDYASVSDVFWLVHEFDDFFDLPIPAHDLFLCGLDLMLIC